LENAIEYAVNVEQSEIITIKSLPPKFANISQLNVNNSTNMSLQEMEKKAILDLLLKNGNTVKGKEQTARELGISLSTLYRRLRLLD